MEGTFQLYFQIILKEHFENMHWCHRTTLALPGFPMFSGVIEMEHRLEMS